MERQSARPEALVAVRQYRLRLVTGHVAGAGDATEKRTKKRLVRHLKVPLILLPPLVPVSFIIVSVRGALSKHRAVTDPWGSNRNPKKCSRYTALY